MKATGNRENLTDSFKVVLDDTTIERAGIPERKIKLRAFDIDFGTKNDENLSQVFIGECIIDPKLVRKN